jgi:predicted alpha/beta hydrolase family esterase
LRRRPARGFLPAALVGSSDDPYADLLFARHLAQDIGARFIDAGAAGYINTTAARAVAGRVARLRQFHGETLTRVIGSEY